MLHNVASEPDWIDKSNLGHPAVLKTPCCADQRQLIYYRAWWAGGSGLAVGSQLPRSQRLWKVMQFDSATNWLGDLSKSLPYLPVPRKRSVSSWFLTLQMGFADTKYWIYVVAENRSHYSSKVLLKLTHNDGHQARGVTEGGCTSALANECSGEDRAGWMARPPRNGVPARSSPGGSWW